MIFTGLLFNVLSVDEAKIIFFVKVYSKKLLLASFFFEFFNSEIEINDGKCGHIKKLYNLLP